MGKLIAWNIMSIDGFFEGDEPWDLRLHEHIWGDDLRDLSLHFGEEAGLLVFGRATYEGMAAHWSSDTSEPDIARYMNRIPKLVASRTLTEPEWNNTEVTADPVGELARRKQSTDPPIYIFGSAELVDSLLEAGLVDELLIGVAPVILGSGTPLLKARAAARPVRFLESRAVDTGGVLLRYRVTDA
ncbi:dihydrofolate reductase family protein [Nesterenkonia sp. CL21]|uniref:dihydrofolate reductase family protein n=1 Tax=Nesterenkonia sp. CL21 TaxID=3064894 RepID=UPI0028786230|nr:dihydrofolate reductase family protein [Nesterenkonia sp. CL21]MDS2173817.1 dihydrofolate reductase family protein [Nesterenkonia sp. CL21]